MNIFEIFRGFLSLIPQLLILTLCIYYLARKKSTDAILMSVGTFIGMLITFFHVLVFPFLLSRNVIGYYSGTQMIMAVVGVIAIIGSLTFAVGLFLLIQDNIKMWQNSKRNQ